MPGRAPVFKLGSMRIGALCEMTSAANYRIGHPLTAMARRGHQIVWPDERGLAPVASLFECDVVLIYRRCGADLPKWIGRLREAGIGVVWDNDDDFLHLPQTRRTRRDAGGKNNREIFIDMVQTASLADAVTVTTDTLACVMSDAGVPGARVIGNHLMSGRRERRAHENFVIGWVAGAEHRPDACGVELSDVLSRLMVKHPNLTVMTVGLDLSLRDRARHEHERFVAFPRLPEVMAGWDIGIAPLLDTPFNRSRSDIKVKEYAASQLPWVASPHGPYATLGERHGGRLAADDAWFDVLDDLIADPHSQQRLATAGAAWAGTQTIDAVADDYEHLFAAVAAKASGRPVSLPTPPAAGFGARLTRNLRRRVPTR